MPNAPDARIMDEAIAWHLRLAQGRAEDWPDFVEWLEADPARNDAYEAVADRDAALPALLVASDIPAPGETEAAEARQEQGATSASGSEPQRATGVWRWGALAASIAVAGLVGLQLMSGQAAPYAIETAAGESRMIALADGSEIRLNGDSRIMLDRSDPRVARLERGEARFAVKHDPASSFTVTVGEARLTDIGTVFNVVRSGVAMRVGVSDGAVRFEGFDRKVDLGAGDTLTIDADGTIAIAKAPETAIGSWAEGVLVYDAAPLQTVAEDLSRGLGITLALSPAMRRQSFSGVIQTNGGPEAVRTRLEELLDTRIASNGSRWTLADQ